MRKFEPNVEARVIRALGKLFEQRENNITEQEAEEGFNIVDPAHVCMATPKTDEAKYSLIRFTEKDVQPKTPTLSYEPEKEPAIVQISAEYLIHVIDILKSCDKDAYKLTVKKDYPLTIENEHFRFIIAPRIEDI